MYFYLPNPLFDIVYPSEAVGARRKILSAAPGGPPAAPGRPPAPRRVKEVKAMVFPGHRKGELLSVRACFNCRKHDRHKVGTLRTDDKRN